MKYDTTKTLLTADNSFKGGKIELAELAPTVKKVDAKSFKANLEITGNLLSNSISAGKGLDTISGGAGDDTLTGGKGNDVFRRFVQRQRPYFRGSGRKCYRSEWQSQKNYDNRL